MKQEKRDWKESSIDGIPVSELIKRYHLWETLKENFGHQNMWYEKKRIQLNKIMETMEHE